MIRIKALIADIAYGNRVTAAVRIFLGILLVFTGTVKLPDPAGFGAIVARYGILPALLVPYAAIVIPPFEIITGLFLVIGCRIRSSAFMGASLMAVFIAAISVNLARGESFDCGCFELNKIGIMIDETISAGVIIRDCVLLGLFAVVLRAKRHVFSLENLVEEEFLKEL